MTLLFLAALGAGVVLFILFPVFARYGEVSKLPSAEARTRKSLSEQKERLYDAIKDVDFEYRAGKLSDTDYQSVRSDLVSQAAGVISRLDELQEPAEPAHQAQEPTSTESPRRPTQPAPAGQPRQEVSANSSAEDVDPSDGPKCSTCDQVNPTGAKFCFRCGEKIAASASCPECGVELPKEARFCTSCGVAIPA